MRTQVFTAVFPLVLFWVIEEFLGLKAALIVGCIAAVGEIIWEYGRTRRVSVVTFASNALVLGLGAVSFYMDSGIAFKMQPMVMELGMAGFLIFTRYKTGESLFLTMVREGKSPGLTPEKQNQILGNAAALAHFALMDFKLTLFLVVHGLAVGAAALWGSTRLWILLKGVLFYVLLAVVMVPAGEVLRKVRASRAGKTDIGLK